MTREQVVCDGFVLVMNTDTEFINGYERLVIVVSNRHLLQPELLH